MEGTVEHKKMGDFVFVIFKEGHLKRIFKLSVIILLDVEIFLL